MFIRGIYDLADLVPHLDDNDIYEDDLRSIAVDVVVFVIVFLVPLGTQLSSLIFGYIRSGKERKEKYRLRVSSGVKNK